MSTREICDARCQAFRTAMIQKEESIRIRWFLKNKQKLLNRLKMMEPAKKIESPTSKLVKQSSTDIICLKPLPNWTSLEPNSSINMDIMKPMHPQVKNLLYEDAPSFITAENYMNERFKDIPEDRYYFPDCTSWIYGWRLSDYPPISRSKVGKTSVTINEFYRWRISSLQRDPEWYRSCQRTSSRCDDDAN